MSASASEEFRLGHRRWLDGLRGVAILAVLAMHLGIVSGGFLGVDIFFVLSGFLITAILAEEWRDRGSIDLRRFYLRRALRLLPAFGVLLAFFASRLFFSPSADETANTIRELLISGCYLTNWQYLHGINVLHLRQTWSLCVEEQFYLIWPIALLTMLRFNVSRRTIFLVVAAGIFLSAAERSFLFWWLRPADRMEKVFRLYMGLDTRADALLVGCLIGLLAAWGYLRKGDGWAIRVAAAGALAVLAYFLKYRGVDIATLYRFEFTVIAALVGIVIVRLLTSNSPSATPLGWILERKPLIWIGRLSYGLYLYHLPLFDMLGATDMAWKDPARCVLATALSLGAAVLSYFVVERPFLRLKKRFENRSLREMPVETPVKRAA